MATLVEGTWWVKGMDAAKHLQSTGRTLTTKNYQGQNVNTVTVENPGADHNLQKTRKSKTKWRSFDCVAQES